MVLRFASLTALAAALAIFSSGQPVAAADSFSSHQKNVKRHSHRPLAKIVFKRGRFDDNAKWRHHRRHDTNTYSGSVVVYHNNNVGTWSYGTVSTLDVPRQTAPTLKIIDVDALAENSACQMQKGVCVIKP